MAPSSTGGTEDGSSDNPFLSWSDVYAVIGHNDTVVLKDGTYTIGTEFAGSNLLPTVTTTLSGSHPDNVIIQGAGGSSGDVTSNGGGFFKKPLSVAYTNDFTVNIHNI